MGDRTKPVTGFARCAWHGALDEKVSQTVTLSSISLACSSRFGTYETTSSSLRGRLKNKFETVLVLFMTITDKAGDANQRTVFKQLDQQRMGVPQADVAWPPQAGATAALHPAPCDRRDPLHCPQRCGLAADAA
jgi:hypothetical protein